ncbi:glycosyltransferase [Flavobacterium sp. MK4S-17]|uniref:glycosyltransferase n=1 Tax=Flavobacterium sp. MK4S-17 TaxID=2543737 RepID=UPI0013572139|nr:glycosyltransferase [Flavobacterium sp. MK4S-17]
MKKILYTASTEIHLLSFHIPYLEWFKNQGYEVHVAYKGTNPIPFADKQWNIPFGRSPLDKTNIEAYRKLKKIIDSNNYNIIHSHTPMASFVTRLASIKARRKGAKVLYTAHGFHFYKGGPLSNWLLFFPVEWLMSHITDGMITINKEDYDYLHSKKFGCKGKYMINGIGIDPKRLKLTDKSQKQATKESLNYNNRILVLYIAEFIDRKNHRFILEAMPEIIKSCPNIKFLFAGGGVLRDKMMNFASENNLDNYTDFLGFQKDIGKFISVADIGVSSSKQEGLGLGVAEMMFNGIPVIISEDRGHKELVQNEENGFMFAQNDHSAFINYVKRLYADEELRNDIGAKGQKSVDKFLIHNSLAQMIQIYKAYV